MINLGINGIKEAYRELLKDNKYSSNEGLRLIIERMMKTVEEFPLDCYSVDELDKHPNSKELSVILACMPPETIYRNFGRDALLWTWLNYPLPQGLDYFEESFMDLGIDERTLKQAHSTIRTLSESESSQNAIKMYDLIEFIFDNGKILVDVKSLARKNWIKGKPIEDIISRLSIEPISPRGYGTTGAERKWGDYFDLDDKRHYKLFLDGPIGISLMYDEKPIAIASYISCDEDTLMCVQMQGVMPKKRFFDNNYSTERSSVIDIRVFDWKKILIECRDEIARSMGMKYGSIISAENITWTATDPTSEHHLPMEIALKKYDYFAESTGHIRTGNGYQFIRKIADK